MTEGKSQPTVPTDALVALFEMADELDPLAWIGPPLDPNLV